MNFFQIEINFLLVANAALNASTAQGGSVVVAILDSGGNLKLLVRQDNVAYGDIVVAMRYVIWMQF